MSATPARPTTDVVLSRGGPPLDEEDIHWSEALMGLRLPESVRLFYLAHNGGSPERYVYEDNSIDTVVSEFLHLPARGEDEGDNLVGIYGSLARDLGIVSPNLVPFAIDGGGDYFLVDAGSHDGDVYFLNSDAADEGRRTVSLGLNFEQFFAALRAEEGPP